MSLIIILNFINKIMSKLDELYKQKEAILKELPNKQRDYKEYYKIHYLMNIEK
jgi:hypothetical protein